MSDDGSTNRAPPLNEERDAAAALRIAKQARDYVMFPLGIVTAVLGAFGVASVFNVNRAQSTVRDAAAAAVANIEARQEEIDRQAAAYRESLTRVDDALVRLTGREDLVAAVFSRNEREWEDLRDRLQDGTIEAYSSAIRAEASIEDAKDAARAATTARGEILAVGDSLIGIVEDTVAILTAKVTEMSERLRALEDATGSRVCSVTLVEEDSRRNIPEWGLSVTVGNVNPGGNGEVPGLTVRDGSDVVFGPSDEKIPSRQYFGNGEYELLVVSTTNNPDAAFISICRRVQRG